MALVQEGKLSPEDAAELIDAFQSSESRRAADPESEATDGSETTGAESATDSKEPFRKFIEQMENLGKDVSESVNWQEVATKVREGAQKGVEQLKVGIERLKEGKLNFEFLSIHETREIELPIDLSGSRSLRVENPCGDVKIVGGHEKASVKAVARVRGMDAEDAKKRAAEYTLIVEESDHHAVVRQPDVSGLRVDIEIKVPSGTTCDVKTSSGNLTITDSEGACKVAANSGNISLRGLEGAVEIVSQSGNVSLADIKSPSLSLENRSGTVRLDQVQGNVNIRTASGDLVMTKCSGKTISLESVSGNVTLDLNEPVTGSVSVRTVNGNSTILIPDGSDCRVSLSTLRGTVSCGLDLADVAKSEQHLTGKLGEGTGTFDVSAVNGSITLNLRDNAS